jgi:beta-glucanase (GH16 family)
LLKFDDEFTGNSLDTSKWSTGWFGSGITGPVNTSDEEECYDPAQVVVSSGELDLNLIQKTETCPSGSGNLTEPYASGIITSNGKYSYTYGAIEARIWVPGSSSLTDWPAFWTDGQNWPTDGEDDILEGLGGQACWHFHNPSGGPGGCSTASFTGGWHTFASNWQPGKVTWYYDGVQVGSLTSGVTTAPMYLILNLAVDNTYGGTIQAPATMRVDYVRVWQ